MVGRSPSILPQIALPALKHESALARQPEAVISVRGKDRFGVMGVAQYHYLRECELDAALAQSRRPRAA